jgi:hypothetical protein
MKVDDGRDVAAHEILNHQSSVKTGKHLDESACMGRKIPLLLAVTTR